MNLPLLIANVLAFLAFFVHIFMGDKALHMIQPRPDTNSFEKQQVWTMARGAFHIISIDIICLNILLAVIIFLDYIPDEKLVLRLVSVYLFVWAVVYSGIILISKPFPNRFIKLPQWLLFLLLSALIYYGSV